MKSEDLARRAEELSTELAEMPAKMEQARQELFNLRFRLATRQLEDTSQVSKARKQVARLKTALSALQREQAWIEIVRREREG
ncbi:MAG: 50S ribosomal protein L29 [Chloroflexi bacterium]|nr:50S ribosomal protein L29 [Chloroflexota bacterium]